MPNLTRIKNNQVTDSTIVASAKLVPGSITGGLFSDPISYSGSMTIAGNLTVQGTTTTVDTTNTLIADPIIVLSRGETGSPSNDAGFLVERGTSDNAAFLWDETNDRFQAITTSADGLAGGSVAVADFADIKMRDAILTGGDITSTVSTVNVFNATATTVNFAGAATTLEIGAATGTTNINNNLDVDGNVNMDGGNFTTTAGTVNIANANSTTVNFAGAATTLEIGAATGTTNINNNLDVDGNVNMDGGNFTTTAGTVNIANANSTTVNFAGAATTLEIGAATGTTNVNNNLDVDGNINLDGGNFTVTASTVNIANANATTVNFAGAATTLEIGAATGTTNINNNLDVDGNVNIDGGNFTTTAATVNLANANTTTLNIGGAATAVSIGAATGTTTVKNDLQIDGGDLTFGAATTANIANATVTTLNIGGAATTTTIGSTSGNVVIAGDLRVNGNQFLSSTGNAAISLSDIDVIVHGNLTVQGATTTIGSQDLTVEDSIINLHTTANLAPLIADDGRDVGLIFHYYKTSDKEAALVWSNDTQELEYYVDAAESAGTVSGSLGTIKANIFYANVATGTAPFTVNSTTRVANLNVAAAGIANTVNDAAQPNITSVGTLTTLNVNAQVNATIFSSNVASGTAPLTVQSTTQVANLNVAVAGSLINGTSNVRIPTTNGNVTIGVGGTANIAIFNSTGVDLSNLNITANTIVSLGTNANINLTPNGTGEVVASTLAITDLSANRIPYSSDAAGTIVDTSNLTFDGSQMVVTGTMVVNGLTLLDNINVNGNTISADNSNGSLNFDANGTGNIVVNSSGINTEFFVYANTSVTASPIIYTKPTTAQLGILTDTPNTNAAVHINATSSMIVPKGSTGQRPSGGSEVAGMLRFNTSTNFIEFYNGSTWESTSGSFTVINYQNFAGDGSTVGYTLSTSSTTAATLVAINGVLQQPSTAYSVSGTSLTFTEAPLSGDDIDIRTLTTTTTVVSLAEGDSSVTVADSGTGVITFTLDGTARWLTTGNTIRPNSNNTVSLGTASYQWANVNAVAININGVSAATSDDATALAIALG
jgi:hypothetical protein